MRDELSPGFGSTHRINVNDVNLHFSDSKRNHRGETGKEG